MPRRRLRVFTALTLFVIGAARAQESRPADGAATRPAATTREDAGEAALRAVDDRLYYAGREGLASLRFSYAPEGTGALTPDFRVQVAWKKGGDPVVSFLDLDRKPLDRTKPHALLDAKDPEREGRTMADNFADGARVLHRFFLGRPYATAYASFRKRVERRNVNGRDEVTVVLEPVTAGGLKRVEMTLGSDGMPWRIVQRLSSAEHGNDVVTLYPAFTTVAERLLLTSFKEDLGTRTDQVAMEFQKVGGFILPSKIERFVKGSTVGGSKTVFDDVEAGG